MFGLSSKTRRLSIPEGLFTGCSLEYSLRNSTTLLHFLPPNEYTKTIDSPGVLLDRDLSTPWYFLSYECLLIARGTFFPITAISSSILDQNNRIHAVHYCNQPYILPPMPALSFSTKGRVSCHPLTFLDSLSICIHICIQNKTHALEFVVYIYEHYV